MEYMEDPGRSKDFCIYGDVVQELDQEMIQRLNDRYEVNHSCMSDSIGPVHDRIDTSCQYHISPFKAP